MADRTVPTADGRYLLAALALAVAVALAGCSFLTGSASGDAALPPGDEAADQYLATDGYTATAHYEYSDRTDRRVRLAVDIDGGNSRIEYLAPPRLSDNVRVYNGSAVVRYNATENEYVRISTTNLDNFAAGADRIASAVGAARNEGATTVERPPPGGAPLPVVPEGEKSSSDAAGEFRVTYEGTASVADREAYVIRYEPVTNDSTGVLSQTVWLDTEHFVTLKSRQVTRFDGNRSTLVFRLSNVTFDPGLTAADFRFDPPADATLDRTDSYDVRSYDSREALAGAADVAVPTAAVPARFTLARANHVLGHNFTAVQLVYQTSGSFVYVTKTTERDYVNLSEGERVEVGGATGRYQPAETRALVAWDCGGYVYAVVGDVDRSTLVSVARSVACE